MRHGDGQPEQAQGCRSLQGDPGLSGSQALGHPSTAGCRGKVANGVEPMDRIAWGQEKGGTPAGPVVGILGLSVVGCRLGINGGRSWEHREASHGRLVPGSVLEGLPNSSGWRWDFSGQAGRNVWEERLIG